MSIRDTRLLERALREQWPIRDEYRDGIVYLLMEIVADKTASHRERTSAAKALIAANMQNIEAERLHQEDEHERRKRLVDIARHLGTDEVARLSAESGVVVEGITDQSQDRREGQTIRTDVQQKSEGKGPVDSTPDES